MGSDDVTGEPVETFVERALYGPDGFHPSRLGTYLAALVIYARLFKDSPIGRPRDLRRLEVAFSTTPRTARLVQAAAATVLGVRPRSVRRCGKR